MYMNDELVMSPSFPFQLKTYEETIMNVHGKDGLITYSSFMYIHNSLFICFKLKWKRWTHHLFIVHVHS